MSEISILPETHVVVFRKVPFGVISGDFMEFWGMLGNFEVIWGVFRFFGIFSKFNLFNFFDM
jgi:hypothetical protein